MSKSQLDKSLNIERALKVLEQKLIKSPVFYGHGTDNAWDEAVQLVLHVLRLPATSGKEVLKRLISEKEKAEIEELLQKRIKSRIPLPYLTHEAWFMGLPFYVDERVLIPRSPFAEWIEQQFVPWIDPQRVKHILDIGTGSACMAIASAVQFPNSQIDAIDISRDALTVAAINVEKYQLQDRVRLIEGDVFDQWRLFPNNQALSKTEIPKYDIILSNPPYVGSEEMSTLPEEYRHEPILALEAEKEGFAIVEKILRNAPNYLEKNGILIVEVGNNAATFQARFPEMNFIELELERGGEGLFLWTNE